MYTLLVKNVFMFIYIYIIFSAAQPRSRHRASGCCWLLPWLILLVPHSARLNYCWCFAAGLFAQQKINRRKCGRLYITKVRQRAPKGSYLELKRRLKGAKRDPKRVKRQPKCIKKLKSERCRQKGRPQGGTIRSFGAIVGPFSLKTPWTNQCKNQCRKSMDIYEKMLPTLCQNEVQNQWQIYEMSEPVISCFVKIITLKSFFYMTRGIRNQSKINEKSM